MSFLVGHDEVGRIGIVGDLLRHGGFKVSLVDGRGDDGDLSPVLCVELRYDLVERREVLAVDDRRQIDLHFVKDDFSVFLFQRSFRRPPGVFDGSRAVAAGGSCASAASRKRENADERKDQA